MEDNFQEGMFKFNFVVDDGHSTKNTENIDKETNDQIDTLICCESQEVIPDEARLADMKQFPHNLTEISIANVSLKYVISTNIFQGENFNLDGVKQGHTDLIPGTYEGGAKLWECTLDLLTYLQTQFNSAKWKTDAVLDLGCGCGLLGIFALKLGSTVHFQDYNADVLDKVTIPNVFLNLNQWENGQNEMFKKAKFFSGDWDKYTELTKMGPTFDTILTSETIYNPQNHKKLLRTFSKKLKRNGIILLAAKSHYFGVGGNLRLFEDIIEADNQFSTKTVWTSSDGVSRAIIELRLNEH